MKRCFIATLAAALVVPAGLAKANTYDVYACWAGAGTFHNPNVSSAAWLKDRSHEGGHFAVDDDCATNTTSGSMHILSVSGSAAARGQYGELTFSAPPGTTIAGASLWRRAWTYGSGSGAGSQRNSLTALTDGAPFVSEGDGTSDVAYGTRGTGDTTNHGIVSSNLLTLNPASRSPSKFAYRVGCETDAGCLTTSPSGPYPNHIASGVEIFGARITVQDVTTPSIAVADSGLLASGDATGIRPVSVQQATDESGIKRLAVYADYDSDPIGMLDYEHDVNRCTWTLPSPCRDVDSVEIPVDTRQLADGDHSIVVKAFDAADNVETSGTRYITVKNPPAAQPTPTPPPSDSTDSGSTPGTGLPNGVDGAGGSPEATSSGNPTLVVAFARNGNARLRAKFGGMVTVVGHLRDGRGGTIADAQIDYSAVSTRAGARAQDLGAVRTDGNGAFSLKVATKLGSRQLRFAYRPQLAGPVAAAAQAQLEVPAPVTLKVSPKRTRNRHRVVFSGRLQAGPIPRKGKVVNLQVIVDGHWHTFATVRTSSTGRFRYRYRFMRTYRRVAYRFRARSRYEAAYPFVAGSSKTVRVRVN